MKLPWARIAYAKLFGGVVVATKDFDGEVRYRIAEKTAFGDFICSAIISSEKVILNSDGKCEHSYVTHWTQVWPQPAPQSAEPVAWREVLIGPGSPELDEPILTWNGNYGVHVLTRIGTELFWDDGITSALPMHDRYAPTHWMPLPATPSEVKP